MGCGGSGVRGFWSAGVLECGGFVVGVDSCSARIWFIKFREFRRFLEISETITHFANKLHCNSYFSQNCLYQIEIRVNPSHPYNPCNH